MHYSMKQNNEHQREEKQKMVNPFAISFRRQKGTANLVLLCVIHWNNSLPQNTSRRKF